MSMYNSASMTSYSVVTEERRESTLSSDIYRKRPSPNYSKSKVYEREGAIAMRTVSPSERDEMKPTEDIVSCENETMLDPSDD